MVICSVEIFLRIIFHVKSGCLKVINDREEIVNLFMTFLILETQKVKPFTY